MSAKPSICFVLPWRLSVTGGVNQVVKNLIREFEADGRFGVVVLEAHWGLADNGDALPSSVKHAHMRLGPFYSPGKPFASAIAVLRTLPGDLRKLQRFARDHNIVVWNVHFPDLAAMHFILLRSLRLFDGKVVLSLHGSDIRTAHGEKGIARRLYKLLLRGADAVVACSDGLRDETLLLEKSCRALTVHNGIDVDLFAANGTQHFRWPEHLQGRRIIINVSGFEYRKGHDLLLDAFAKISGRYSDTALVLVGRPGPVSAAVRKTIADTGLDERVVILEDVPHAEVYNLLAQSTLFVLASRWRVGSLGEGFPLAILEAAAANLPVVATASCGIAEIIQDRETGRLVPLEDSDALAVAISDMLEHPMDARIMADKLHALVRTTFTWRRTAEQYEALCASETMSSHAGAEKAGSR